MAYLNPAERAKRVWALAARQHGVIALFQLLALGFTRSAIKHRVAKGRLHPVRRGVYAVGRPKLPREGEWMAAVLSCGPETVLSHESAAALWGIRRERTREIHVTMPRSTDRRGKGIAPHSRRSIDRRDLTRHMNIPVTTPVVTLIDLATRIPAGPLEDAINEADKLDLVDPPRLRRALDARQGRRGTRTLMDILDRSTFMLTDSQLERYFLPITARAGLPRPQTQWQVNGFRVDFYWPDLGLVVETDGLRYHRTAGQQAKDRLRDQTHTAAGLTPLRFTHWQIRHDPLCVERTLVAVAHRLAA
jgi:very-short-patch-repair endonuclease/predicted transcriptional regulator of viral defense system